MSATLTEDSPTVSAMARLFAGLSDEAVRTQYKSGEVIYDMGSPANHIYLIHRGQVRQYQLGSDSSCRLVEILGPGQWFGCGALTGREIAATRTVAVTTTTLGALPAHRIIETLADRPDAAREIIAQLACSLQTALNDASRLVFDDCNQRLVAALLRFSNSAAATPTDEGVVLHITHGQLAQAVGVARETVSLALTQLRQRNLLRTGRNQLYFNPKTLREFHQPPQQAGPPRQPQVA